MGNVIAQCISDNNLFRLGTISFNTPAVPTHVSYSASNTEELNTYQRHQKLASEARPYESSADSENEAASYGRRVDKYSFRTLTFCTSCALWKSTRAKFPSKGATRAIDLLDLVHTDIRGTLRTQTFSERIQIDVENYLNKSIKVLRSDNALEYKSGALTEFCTLHGIQRQFSILDTPGHNGVAERKNRTLIDSVVAMFTHSGLSHGYWGEAIHTTVYLQNRSPSKALPNDKTPYELWHGQKPDLHHLQVFGCTAFAHIEKGHRVREATFPHQQASVVPPAVQEGFTPFRPIPLAPSTDPVRRILPAERPPAVGEFSPLIPSPGVGVPQAPSTSSVSHPPTAEVPATYPARFGQTYQRRRWKLRENPLSSATLVDTVRNLENLLGELRLQDTTSEVPATATARGQLHPLPAPSILSFEGVKELVAKGYSQVYGVDFSEPFSPVVKMTSIRVLMALAAQYNLELHQMDVKTAFLNGVLDEEVYMALPEGLNISYEKNMVCKLNKSIYGLKQSSRQWYQGIDSFLLTADFTRADADQNVYIYSKENAFVYLALYVDDCILASDSLHLLTNIKEKLKISELD
ncbi:hypothetical protein AXG93_2584s1140 [Marchantia polymorpha subsp. ruderalis]|uniref:Integrase catalytic domain-containing protein n=1 Tax=Marchantia polymorpha subsp. ruderalis TaxID=1480154 RepID=A0A176VGP8_MARPO|nr:hypothetical protein AXG93_2584s1140 [Marchantia polymorpha subsp. ruderalis]